MGFGAEILFILLLGLLVLGPKRLHTVLADVARAKARFEEASRGFKSQLTAELEADSPGPGAHEQSRFLAAESSPEAASRDAFAFDDVNVDFRKMELRRQGSVVSPHAPGNSRY